MILVINCGSQSIKWKLFSLSRRSLRAKAGEKLKPLEQGSAQVLDELNKLKGYQVSLVGHRVVHGGGEFTKSTKITDNVLQKLEKLNHLAPLHNPYNILGIKTCQNIFPGVPQFAVFDTEFYAKFLPKVYTYPLPEDIREKYGFRRFGFHGISHEYVSKKLGSGKIISCHLGGGTSITAIKNGIAVDTSMGFSPLSGAVMMTRPGDIDDEIIFQMAEKFGLEKTREILNFESGLKGICGAGNMLEVLNMVKLKNKNARLALDVFIYSIQKYIGAYYAVLGGCDALVFTGSIGFGSAKIRNMICKDLKILSKAKILAIETDEELAIARKILNFK